MQGWHQMRKELIDDTRDDHGIGIGNSLYTGQHVLIFQFIDDN